MNLEAITQLARWIFLALGVGVIVWALFVRDRSKGRRRCPKCWYDMSATEGMTCPECGREQATEKRFFRRRRSWRRVLAGVMLLVLSYAAYVGPDVYRGGWMFAIPRTVLILVAPFIDTPNDHQIWAIRKEKGFNLGVVGPPVGEPTVFHRMYEHLLNDRVPRDKDTFVNAYLNADLRRRARRPESPPWLLGEYMRRDTAAFVNDRALLERTVLQSLMLDTLQAPRPELSGYKYFYATCWGLGSGPYAFRINGFLTHWNPIDEMTLIDPRLPRNDPMATRLFVVYPKRIPIATTGPERGVVNVQMSLDRQRWSSIAGTLPEFIEFDVRVPDGWLD